ncbi:hypothetical protein [Flavobacterium sp.]|uniref:hypothetical protein n=1 Tax=Flavobacterium sp. TaxID=239 RepID=UPI003D6C3890
METITTLDFLKYLESLNLFRWNITLNKNGFEAVISQDTVPSIKNFTQVEENKDGTFWVRLSKIDIYNESITNGFFNR